MSIYSRDMAAPALRTLDRVLKMIREGMFDPDTTRSGYFRSSGSGDKAPPAKKVRVEDKPFVEEEQTLAIEKEAEKPDSDSSSDSSSSSSGSDDDGPVDLDETFASEVCYRESRRPAGFENEQLYQHKIHGTLHIRHRICVGKLGCGRVQTSSYNKIDRDLSFDWPRCKVCFGAVVEDRLLDGTLPEFAGIETDID